MLLTVQMILAVIRFLSKPIVAKKCLKKYFYLNTLLELQFS